MTEQLNYERTGSGTPMVLIHGIGGSWEHWRPLIGELAPHHDLILPDLPGFGRSPRLPEGQAYTLDNLADALAELMDQLGVERAHIVGNSLGGGIGADLVKRHRALSYTGISAAGQLYGRASMFAARTNLMMAYYGARFLSSHAAAATKLRPVRVLLMNGMAGKPGRWPQSYAADMLEGCARGSAFMETFEQAETAREFISPTSDFDHIPRRMLWGTRDQVLLPVQGRRWAKEWPGLELITLPGLGHVPMADDPQLVSRLILENTAKADQRTSAPAPA